ncbi:hypothetical protein RCO28_34325 [Streptomyces sp. LHD-70]|uniref:hypothetical protein n=1 Tax=Streptomyces sp. LHD-70 TaxID=3072140 RepID=UPI00280C43A9|nr:hypothetical protein [Streptomyces sp. LHD-70]MDQ8707509.1 hypothetical protein [Streptomyces sp. LHD-70]
MPDVVTWFADLADLPEQVWQFVVQERWLLAGGLVACGVVWAGAGTWWWARGRRALADRVEVDVVPSSEFDPTFESIERHAARLSRVPEAAGWLPRRARAVRIRLLCEDGELVYRLEGPARAGALLRLPAFPGVDMVDAGGRGSGGVPQIHFEGVPPLPRDVSSGSASEADEDVVGSASRKEFP